MSAQDLTIISTPELAERGRKREGHGHSLTGAFMKLYTTILSHISLGKTWSLGHTCLHRGLGNVVFIGGVYVPSGKSGNLFLSKKKSSGIGRDNWPQTVVCATTSGMYFCFSLQASSSSCPSHTWMAISQHIYFTKHSSVTLSISFPDSPHACGPLHSIPAACRSI